MMLGRTLIIADPDAHRGHGESAALYVTRFFSSFHSATNSCEVRLTEKSNDAVRMASNAAGYDTIIALGGDSLIHEVVNGLMSIPEDDRPHFGLVPIGTSNDFARTLGLSPNDPERSIEELLSGHIRKIDVGRVNDTYFMQTLSFGLDAAIALQANERAHTSPSRQNPLLFVSSGIQVLAIDNYGWGYRALVDGEPHDGITISIAIQNGPTYGGGFRICPKAAPNDGMLDLCLTLGKPNRLHTLALFGLARTGHHTISRRMCTQRVRTVELEFTGPECPPSQADGVRLPGYRFEICVVSQALAVIAKRSCAW